MLRRIKERITTRRLHWPIVAIAILLALPILSACQSAEVSQAEENKAIIQRYLDGFFNQGDLTVVDELIAVDFVDHGSGSYDPRGVEDFKQSVISFREAYPDLHVEIEHIVAEGDKVAYRFKTSGTQQIDFFGIPPTGKPLVLTGNIIDRIEDGKIVERWENFDEMGFMTQLGFTLANPSAE